MPGLVNQLLVQEYEKDFEEKQDFILTDYQGMSVDEMGELRRSLEGTGAQCRVVKNSLFSLFAKQKKMELGGLQDLLKGTSAVVLSSDILGAAKVVKKFSKDVETFNIKGGYVDGRAVSVADIEKLATIGSRDELIAKLLMCLNSPISQFVNVLSGVTRSFVSVLDEIKKQKEKEV